MVVCESVFITCGFWLLCRYARLTARICLCDSGVYEIIGLVSLISLRQDFSAVIYTYLKFQVRYAKARRPAVSCYISQWHYSESSAKWSNLAFLPFCLTQWCSNEGSGGRIPCVLYPGLHLPWGTSQLASCDFATTEFLKKLSIYDNLYLYSMGVCLMLECTLNKLVCCDSMSVQHLVQKLKNLISIQDV